MITAGKKGQKVDEEKLLEEIKKRLIDKKSNGEIKRIHVCAKCLKNGKVKRAQ